MPHSVPETQTKAKSYETVPTTKRYRRGPCAVPQPKHFNVPENEAQVLDLPRTPILRRVNWKSFFFPVTNQQRFLLLSGWVELARREICLHWAANRKSGWSHGVWFIQLGQDVPFEDLPVELNILVDSLCSVKFAAGFSGFLKERRGVVIAIMELVKDLQQTGFLLMFNDVRRENEAYSIVNQVANAVSASSGSLETLISPRREEIAHRPLTNAVVDVSPKDSQGIVGRRIFMVYGHSRECTRTAKLPMYIPETDLDSIGTFATHVWNKTGACWRVYWDAVWLQYFVACGVEWEARCESARSRSWLLWRASTGGRQEDEVVKAARWKVQSWPGSSGRWGGAVR